ncbi:MAG: group II truncated hemoglobin [Methylococcaceae bacterium]|jgi:hemoglobin
MSDAINNEKTTYELIGGEKAIATLVERFYFYMDTLPEAKAVRAVHGESLASAQVKLFKYLSGWLGGPDLFVQEYGHPRLRQRHFPFKVGVKEKDEWMMCMIKALNDIPMEANVRETLIQAFAPLAAHMVNQ